MSRLKIFRSSSFKAVSDLEDAVNSFLGDNPGSEVQTRQETDFYDVLVI